MKTYIFGNWKSHKTSEEALSWLSQFNAQEGKEVVLFVPYVLLPVLREKTHGFSLGAQNLSPFSEGAYTGEVSARQIQEFVSYVLIGHSERRTHFQETDEVLFEKVTRAKEAGLTVVYCVQNENARIPEHVNIVAYEPPSAIGTGNPDTPENANTIAEKVKQNNPQVTSVVYGGSVTKENVSSFTKQPFLDGVLVGSASLDPQEFSEIVTYA